MAEILELNDTRLHLAVTQNALVIPPESRVRRGRLLTGCTLAQTSSKRSSRLKRSFKKQALKQMAREFQCSMDELSEAIDEIAKVIRCMDSKLPRAFF